MTHLSQAVIDAWAARGFDVDPHSPTGVPLRNGMPATIQRVTARPGNARRYATVHADALRMDPPKRGLRPVRPLTPVETVLHEVAVAHDLSVADMLSGRRLRHHAYARFHAAARLRDETRLSLPQIGRRLGGRDHSTAIHAIKRFHDLAAQGVFEPFGVSAVQAAGMSRTGPECEADAA